LYFRDNRKRADAHFHLAIRIKVGMLAASGLLMYFAAEPLAHLTGYPELTEGYRFLSVGIVGIGFFEFFQAVFQARQDFKQLTILRVSEAACKIGFIYLFIAQSSFSLTTIYLAYATVPLGLVLLVFAISKKLHVSASYEKREIGKELFSFVKWLMLTTFAMIFLQHLDTLLIAKMYAGDTAKEAGLFYVLTAAISTVLFPKAMALSTMLDLKQYVKRTLQITIPLSIASILYVLGLVFLVPVLLPDYAPALPVVYILTVGWVWTIIGNPLTMLMLALNKANIATAVSIVQLMVTIVSHYLFINWLGGIGAAISNVLIWFVFGSYSLWYIYSHRSAIEAVKQQAVQS
jgi:O-antigen/teichoic acid export membrane protein